MYLSIHILVITVEVDLANGLMALLIGFGAHMKEGSFAQNIIKCMGGGMHIGKGPQLLPVPNGAAQILIFKFPNKILWDDITLGTS
jgi:hypothetical protein